MDIFLVRPARGRGSAPIGATLARHLVHDLGHHRLIIDPALDNERAIRCYEKVGFRRWPDARVLGPRRHVRDSLLMDLLARELA